MSLPEEVGKTIAFSTKRPPEARAVHCLTAVQGVVVGRSLAVTSEPLVLGRDPSRPFHLPDAEVSRSHCEVRLAGDVVLVRDLGSTNGTFVDGRRATGERALPPSSRLHVGRHVFRHDLLAPEEVARQEQLSRELERARRYVEALIPAPLQAGPVRTAWCFVPCSVLGGDAFGYHELEAGALALYVLDMDDHSGMYCSVFYGVLEPGTGRLVYSSAGHPPALLLDAAGRVRSRLALRNPPIGTLEGQAFGQEEAVLGRGERLYLFSDGAYELRDRDGCERGLEDFERLLLAPEAERLRGDPRSVYERTCELVGAGSLEDDFTLLVVERVPT
jgi:pSer/pThr/pTyr-binding forkhead associated (FHA) protein